MTTVALRPYQVEAIEAIETRLAEGGVRRPLVALPTGTGKTVVFSSLIRRRGGTALILAHRDELLQQARDKLTTVAPELGLSAGFVQAGRNDTTAPVVIASVQTLAREARLAQMPVSFDTVIIDEAHHATAASYRRILDHLERSPLVAGFTATPERADKQRLEDVFDEIVYARSIEQMIREGYLCNMRGRRVELDELNLAGVKVSRGDYQASDLGRALDDAHAQQAAVDAYRQHAPGRKAISFHPTVALAHETAAAFRASGYRAAAVDGETDPDERRRILAAFTAGEIQIVANVDVLTEGYDEPSVDCIILAAPTKSRIKYAQRVGRGTRLFPGKPDCLVLDLVGTTEDLTLQSLPALFGLEAEPEEGETVTEALDREQRQRAETEAEQRDLAERREREARDVDLFTRDRIRWLREGARHVMSAGRGQLLALDPQEGGGWRVLFVTEDRAKIVARNLDIGYAQGVAEEWIRRAGATALADKQAKWRSAAISPGQRGLLRRLGVNEPPATKGEAADEITKALARERFSKLDAALERRRRAAEEAAA
jgi:ATP-dependent helicase IRC3